ncbi:hypothetical protein LTR27_001618 [Elasticomyces elasticus]|nr:hypothetical protein LTR27_001618 [Elasticomyces elasticus]
MAATPPSDLEGKPPIPPSSKRTSPAESIASAGEEATTNKSVKKKAKEAKIDAYVTKYIQDKEAADKRLKRLKKHRDIILEGAQQYAECYQVQLDLLNRSNQVKLFNLEEFGQPAFEQLIQDICARTSPFGAEAIFTRLFDAVLVKIAVLVDKVRSEVAKLSQLAVKLAQDATFQAPPVNDEDEIKEVRKLMRDEVSRAQLTEEIDNAKEHALEFYRAVIKSFKRLINGNRQEMQELTDSYPTSSEVVVESTQLTDHNNRIEFMKTKIETALSTETRMLIGECYSAEWEEVRHALGGALADQVVRDYDHMRSAFNAVVETAKKVSPTEFGKTKSA